MNEPAGGTPRGARRGDGLAVTATRPSPSTRHSTFLGEARLAAFVRFARDAIYSRDADGIITTWNPAAEELYGYAAHEIVGQPLSVLVPEEQAAAEGEVQRRTFAGTQVPPYDALRVRRDGSVVSVSIMVSPIFDEAGTVVEAATIARDVSVRKEAEAMTARFVANAAHELRTPLTTLSALTSAMARRWPEMDEAKRQELFSAIGRQGERARLLINNLLELSQLEAGRLKVEPAVVEPAAIVERTVEDVPPPEGKTVLFDPDGARGATAWADPIRLSQVTANLLTNAYKYGGSKVEVSMERPHGGVRVIVSDDGPGLPAELLTSAFEPFTRGHAVGVAQGSGLGLAICRAMLEAFGASIAYDGSGPGARFVVDLPPSP